MVVHELENILLDELGFKDSPDLHVGDAISWSAGRKIPDIQSAFFLKSVPVAYFSRFTELNPEKIQQLHTNVWSQSKAPLLFVTLPHEIRIYNGYDTPQSGESDFDTPQRLLQKLSDLTDHLVARNAIRQKLVEENHYERVYLETGAFWNTSEGQRIDYEMRADKQLVESMGQMRDVLKESGLSNDIIYTLLGRSVFIRYLEDRGGLLPQWIEQVTENQARSYREALEAGRQVTYNLFEALSTRFNGDLFPVESPEQNIKDEHLQTLLSFLNRTNLKTGQLSLWPYNFEFIPIELISHIYDTFIDDQRQSGAYYTPLLLADFILEETMGDEVIHPDMKVLDPACGSGIFLVGAFRRLVQAWRQQHKKEPDAEDLNRLVKQNIFGVDKKRPAVRIAAFSLYLEILNHLTNKQIQDESFRFPSLQGHNLVASDFFDEEVDYHFSQNRFDRIVGNLPWGRGTLTKKASKWLATNNHIVGSKQIAPAFMLRIPQFTKDDGEIALLAPAKSTIFVSSKLHQAFRNDFFTTFNVRAIVNFSALVYELFSGAISPAVAFFYHAHLPNMDDKLVYAVPKPSPLSQHLKSIVLDTTEVKFLDRKDVIERPYLWKVAQWGTPRDAALIERLCSLDTLRENVDQRGWLMSEGIVIRGGEHSKKTEATWLKGKRLIPTGKFRSYSIDLANLETISDTLFHRPRISEITLAPLVLIHKSQCAAAYSSIDIVYQNKILGIKGKEEDGWLLKWLVAYINSPLCKYYQFLTSTSWAVERATIIQQEYEKMPFLIPDQSDPRLQELLQYVEKLRELLNTEEVLFNAERNKKLKEYETAIRQLVYELYELHPVEQQQVEDTLAYGLGFFEWSKRKTRKPGGAKPVQKPDTDMLRTYAEIFIRTATSMLRIKNQTLNAIVYKNGAPLTVVSFELVPLNDAQAVRVVDEHSAMRTKLRELDKFLIEQKTPSMYMRRHVKVYDGNTVSLVRPSEQRFWTQSQARADADAF